MHILCQKIKLFRYEQRVKTCPTFAFWFATLCSELPFALASSLVSANLVYFMSELNVGVDNWLFFVGVVSCVAGVGITVAIALSAVIRREMIVRDLFLLFSFLMTISNGYLFHYDQSQPYIEKVKAAYDTQHLPVYIGPRCVVYLRMYVLMDANIDQILVCL